MSSKPRHKSCLACIQTKRKCDRTRPRCQRCIARGSECHYLGRVNALRGSHVDTHINQPDLLSEEALDTQSPDTTWQLQRHHAGTTTTATATASHTVWPGDASFEFPNHPFNIGCMPDGGTFILDDIRASVNQQLLSAADSNLQLQQRMSLDTRLQDRVEFVAKRLQRIPQTFVEQGQTAFIHRSQFQQTCPPALQDAMSACALYCMKNMTNKALVFRNLEHKCQQLITDLDALLASKTDLLAALQALLLYQMVRLFDGDIRLRANAEADEPVVILWATELRARMCSVARAAALEPSSSSSNVNLTTFALDRNSDWQSWLVDESIRRTVITAFMLKGVYNFLKTGYDNPAELRVYFTAQQALWEAQSELGWSRAQEERERLEMQVVDWDETVGKATPADLEELGVLIMTMLWGSEATQTWLGHEIAHKYGFEMA